MLCEWRAPVRYPLSELIDDLRSAIARTVNYVRVDAAARPHAWLRELDALALRSGRAIAVEMARAIRTNIGRHDVADPAEANREADRDHWSFESRDSFRSLLEARMYVHVVNHLESKLQPAQWRALVGGNLRPEADKPHAPHRDFLLELYIASAVESAGFNVQLIEPDIVASMSGTLFAIAVKRIQSQKKILSNAKKGADQIAASSAARGVVFLDVSNIMNTKMTAVRYVRDRGATIDGTVLGHLMRFAREHSYLRRLLGQPHIKGIVLRHAVSVMFGPDFIPGTLETWSPIIDEPSEVSVTLTRAMLDALSGAPSPLDPRRRSGMVPCEFSFAHC